jgi:hypothetical protein
LKLSLSVPLFALFDVTINSHERHATSKNWFATSHCDRRTRNVARKRIRQHDVRSRKLGWLMPGAISLSSSTHLPAIVGSTRVKPVTLPRPWEARDEAAADRIGNGRENNGDGARLL